MTNETPLNQTQLSFSRIFWGIALSAATFLTAGIEGFYLWIAIGDLRAIIRSPQSVILISSGILLLAATGAYGVLAIACRTRRNASPNRLSLTTLLVVSLLLSGMLLVSNGLRARPRSAATRIPIDVSFSSPTAAPHR